MHSSFDSLRDNMRNGSVSFMQTGQEEVAEVGRRGLLGRVGLAVHLSRLVCRPLHM
jgi:hypothetical protein